MDNREGFLMIKFITMFVVFSVIVLSATSGYAAQTKEATRTRDAYAPFEDLIQITPSDVTVFSPPLRGCIVEVAGDLDINPIKSASNVLITVVVGQLIPVIITKVRAATTATVVCGR